MGTEYSTEAISGYNATPPADDGTVSEANKVKWSTIKTKLPDPLKTAIENIDTKLVAHFDRGPTALTTNTTLGASHFNKIVQVSGAAVTLTLTDAATLTAGWYCDIVSTDGTNSVTLARATASNMINETSADVTILPLQELRVFVNAAANGFLVNTKARHSKEFKTAENYTHTGTVTMSGKSMYWAKGADIASAATLVLGTDGNMFDVTGSTGPITALTVPAGMMFMLQFDSTPTLTHHATNLNLPGGANITAAAGDRLIGFATAANTVHVIDYVKANGKPVIGSLISGTAVATTSGTSWAFTGFPSWVTRITIEFNENSTNSGADDWQVQIGDAGGIETSGYISTSARVVNAGASATTSRTDSFHMITGDATYVASGIMVLTLVDAAAFTWVESHSAKLSTTVTAHGGGSKSLSSTLDRLTVLIPTGPADAGSINVKYE